MDTKQAQTLGPSVTGSAHHGAEGTNGAAILGPDSSRRRFVRGALIAAPAILTVRSGVGAAGSLCIAALDPNGIVDQDGTLSSSATADNDSFCVEFVTSGTCQGNSIDKKAHQGAPFYTVSSVDDGQGGGGTVLQCLDSNNSPLKPGSGQINVAIINGHGVNSLGAIPA